MDVVFGGPAWWVRLSAALPPLLFTAINLPQERIERR